MASFGRNRHYCLAWMLDPFGRAIRALALGSCCALAAFVDAEVVLAKQQHSGTDEQRIRVEGNSLIFDGFVEHEDGDDSINEADTAQFHTFLKAYPEIREVVLRSSGGIVSDAIDIAVIVADYGLDTRVESYCLSACTLIFIAGEQRTLGPGGRLGFHSGSWARDSIKEFYMSSREVHGWIDEFAFAAWVYEEGIRDMNKILAFFAAHKVDLNFIVRATFVHSDDMWYPTRDELHRYGIIEPGAGLGSRHAPHQ